MNPVRNERDVTVLELVDRLLGKGVVISGDLVLSVADIDLVYVGLRVLLASPEAVPALAGAPGNLAFSEDGEAP